MPPLTRRSSAAGAAGKNPANYAEIVAARRARAPAAAAAGSLPTNEAVFALFRAHLLALSPQERAGFLEESLADDPDVSPVLGKRSNRGEAKLQFDR